MTESDEPPLRLYLVRHGETEWSLAGRHTGKTDLPLTAAGHRQADRLGSYFRDVSLVRVFSSPLRRARQTCDAAGLPLGATIDADLAEWDYGTYEGRRTADIQCERPDWNLFRDGCPGGETPGEVAVRADRMIARVRDCGGAVVFFSHGQFGSALAARWIGLPIAEGQHLAFDPAAIGVLGEKPGRSNVPMIVSWNVQPQLYQEG